MSIALLAVALSGVPAEQCRQTHYMADGRVIVSTVSADGAGASAQSSSHGNGSASSSVSASSSSDGRGTVSSSTSSSSADGQTRTVSVKRDANGCTVTIDDRPNQE